MPSASATTAARAGRRSSMNSTLLPGVLTVARDDCPAGRRFAGHHPDLLAVVHQVLELPQHHLPHVLRQMIIQRVAVYLERMILPALALVYECAVVIQRQCGMQIGPAAARCAWYYTANAGIPAASIDELPQLGGCAAPAVRNCREKLPQGGAGDVLRAGPKSALARPSDAQKLVQGDARKAMAHGDTSTSENEPRLPPERIRAARNPAGDVPIGLAGDSKNRPLPDAPRSPRETALSRGNFFHGKYDLHAARELPRLPSRSRPTRP